MDTTASMSEAMPIDPITSKPAAIVTGHLTGDSTSDNTSDAKCSVKTGPRIAVVNMRTKTTLSILSSNRCWPDRLTVSREYSPTG
jgi:hypothetical protein